MPPVASMRIGLFGIGTVGRGLVRLLRQNRAAIRARAGVPIELRRACEIRPDRASASGLPAGLLTDRPADILDDPEISAVVELVGGTKAAHEIVAGALQRGKHVVTANKSLLAERWPELIGVARRHGVGLFFEASVMSGVPVIRALNAGLAGNVIEAMLGILNGTTNYILSRMLPHDGAPGMDYREALARAQADGFSEADPTFDVSGADTAYKLSILASIALGRWLPPSAIWREGISGLQPKDILYAHRLFDYRPKLLAVFKHHGGRAGVEARVHPAFVPATHPLAAVRDEFNALHIAARPVGPVMLYGKGAGSFPAASGVVSDLVDLARALRYGVPGEALTSVHVAEGAVAPRPIEEARCKYYLRFTTADRPGVLAAIAGAFGQQRVSIESVYQAASDPKSGADIVMITHRAREGSVQAACRTAAAMRSLMRPAGARPALIRIEEGEEGEEGDRAARRD